MLAIIGFEKVYDRVTFVQKGNLLEQSVFRDLLVRDLLQDQIFDIVLVLLFGVFFFYGFDN